MGGSSGGGAERIITDDMKASAEVAAEQWNRYQDFYVPFEKEFMADVTKDPAQTESTLKGQVNADMMQAAAKTAPVDPVRGMPALSSGAMTKGLSKGFGTARTAAVDQQQQGLNTAIAMGRGQAVQAMTTQQQLAEQSGQTALQESISSAQNDMASRGAMFKGIGMAAGLAGNLAGGMMSSGPSSADISAYTNTGMNTGNWTGNPALTNLNNAGVPQIRIQ